MEKRILICDNSETRVSDGEDNKRVVSGYAAKFNEIAYGEVVRPGAFNKSLNDGGNVVALWNHDSSKPLASLESETLSLEVDDIGLKYEFSPADTTDGRNLLALLDPPIVNKSSFQFRTIKDKMTRDDEGNVLRELLEVDLIDVSPVLFPWYDGTSVGLRCLSEETGVPIDEIKELLKNAADEKRVIKEDPRIELYKKQIDLMSIEI
jgi:HK97 family phage prohead protease